MYVVHGFASASYSVIEGSILDTTFFLNVKGETGLQGAVTGVINSRAGGTSRKLFHDHQCEMFYKIRFTFGADALLEQDISETQI